MSSTRRSLLIFPLLFLMELQSTTSVNPNPLSSHVLDTAIGRPAANLTITLFKSENETAEPPTWALISEHVTNNDGRVRSVITPENFTVGIYRLHFDSKGYYESQNVTTFYPYIDVVFEITDIEEHYHIPILLSAYGYTTYRGS